MKKATLYRLDSADLSWIFHCGTELPYSLYFGPKLAFSADLEDNTDHLMAAISHAQPPGVLDTCPLGSLIPEAGRGFMEQPGIALSRHGHALQTQYVCEHVESGANSLEFLATDQASNTSLSIRINVDRRSNVFCVSSSVLNLSPEPLAIDWLAACSLNLPDTYDEIGLFNGRWSHEFQLQRQRLCGASLVKENRRGRTSHQSFPAILSGSPGFSWQEGRVYAAHLGWSGNHRVLAAKNRDSGHFLQLGELLATGEIILQQDESYQSPPVYLSASDAGLNPLMANFHHYVRHNILREATRTKPRPVHYNTWEACYFSQSEEKTSEMIKAAAAIGVERFVVDDGWFRGRNDDTAGLGDWTVCENKYPSGLRTIGQEIKSAGMEFGLWFEPEMVNANSDLFRAHPDWVIAVDGLEPVAGRNQFALNLCRPEVVEYLVETLSALIDELELDYIKWDMNRDLTHVLSRSNASNHEMTNAFYLMAGRLREKHPKLEIEICSSGGARADYGALAYGERIWPSDNHDVLDKQHQRETAFLFFPPEVLGNHIGASPDHHSGRRFSLAQRALAAGIGHMGIEMDVSSLSALEAEQLRYSIADYKTHRGWLQASTLINLSRRDSNIAAMLRIAQDTTRARLYVMQRGTGHDTINPPLSIAGLEPGSRYRVTELQPGPDQAQTTSTPPLETTGELLLHAGLPLPLMQPDTWLVYDIEKTSDSNATS